MILRERLVPWGEAEPSLLALGLLRPTSNMFLALDYVRLQ